MLGLKAQLAAKQDEPSRGGRPRSKRGRDELDEFGRTKKKNKAVKQRAKDDKDTDETKAVIAKLAAKSQLYEELASGSKHTSATDVLVDFAGKSHYVPTPNVADEDHGAGTKWAWSTGKEAQLMPNEVDMASMLAEAARETGAPASLSTPYPAIMRSQWEKTLTPEQRGLLEVVSVETAEGRRLAQLRARECDRRRQALAARLGALQRSVKDNAADAVKES